MARVARDTHDCRFCEEKRKSSVDLDFNLDLECGAGVWDGGRLGSKFKNKPAQCRLLKCASVQHIHSFDFTYLMFVVVTRYNRGRQVGVGRWALRSSLVLWDGEAEKV